ncbi:E3 ubiquitin-protein ligase TRIM39-like [Sphaeramia orbicularis]|uniref:E3 ubiquitin-protein ligase TRIM39-like n=1 Tax=Sphaeramia orbicularis TaxID=375764 RepID=UPI00117CA6E3|nr:E3 ubiquitin-protein ligase TRIM39-like [Sphaeramia orbicularis]
MAAAGCVRSEDQFLCSICVEVFTDPVTIPCGHNFCKSCISEHWGVNVPYQCPMCKEVFNTKPQLKINTFISEMVAQFRHEAEHEAVVDHKNHEFVPLKDEHEEQKPDLKKTEAEIQQMIQERQLKIQEIQQSVELSQNAADTEEAEGVEVYTALMESVPRSLDQFKEKIQEKQRSTEKQAEDFIKELEQEICELKKRTAPSMKTWTKVSVRPPSYEGTVVRALYQLEDTLREDMKEKKEKVVEAELKRVQEYEMDVTLDPDTAHPNLLLSDDGKQVHYGDERKNLPDKPQRFCHGLCVVAKQSFSSGRFYFEVQVKGKTDWTLGVVSESINRKEGILPRPRFGYWTICLINGNLYIAAADPCVCLSVKSDLQKVGVFVDYEEGLVSFYDVDSSVLFYSFTGCCFSDKLLPIFDPGRSANPNAGGLNSAPLIITPVTH